MPNLVNMRSFITIGCKLMKIQDNNLAILLKKEWASVFLRICFLFENWQIWGPIFLWVCKGFLWNLVCPLNLARFFLCLFLYLNLKKRESVTRKVQSRHKTVMRAKRQTVPWNSSEKSGLTQNGGITMK